MTSTLFKSLGAQQKETLMWRKDMRTIVDGLKHHMNLRSDTQAAEFLGITRQHLHISVMKDKLMPDRLIESCIKHDIDITRLVKDGRATKLSEIDYSDTDIPISVYKDGSVIPNAKRNLPKWFAEVVFRRKVGLNEVLGMIELETDEMEPKIKQDSVVYIDTASKTPVGGLFYLDVQGYGMMRRLLKATEQDKWFLTGHSDDSQRSEAITYGTDFTIIGKVQFMTTRI